MKKKVKAAVARIDRAIAEFDNRLVAQSARLVEIERTSSRWASLEEEDRATGRALAESEAKRHAAEVTLVSLREAYKDLKQQIAGKYVPSSSSFEDIKTRLDDPAPAEASPARRPRGRPRKVVEVEPAAAPVMPPEEGV